ncbi:hypothetical protein [Halosimplex aquaticum]|nr:hypothetical protein [Halosimplex aquaticum]
MTGCLSRGSGGSLAVGDSFRTAAGATVTVADIRLRRTLFDMAFPDAVVLLAPPESQFVLVTVSLDGRNALVPDPSSFGLSIDGAGWTGSTRLGGTNIDHRLSTPNDAVHRTPSGADERGDDLATVGFTVPVDVEPDQVSVAWERDGQTARWIGDDGLADALGSPPDFRVEAIDHPDAFACDERFDVSVTVANDGGRAGVFQAVFPAVEPIDEGHPDSFAERIPSGESKTWTGSLEFPPHLHPDGCDDDVQSATFELDWGLGTRAITLERRT